MEILIVKNFIRKDELHKIAAAGFGDVVKAVVDIKQNIMALGGELHADEEAKLTEEYGSKREDLWGINLYPKKTGADWIEFDSMINIKPQYGNSSRGIEDEVIRVKIVSLVNKIVKE